MVDSTKTHIVCFQMQMERNLTSQRSVFACEMQGFLSLVVLGIILLLGGPDL